MIKTTLFCIIISMIINGSFNKLKAQQSSHIHLMENMVDLGDVMRGDSTFHDVMIKNNKQSSVSINALQVNSNYIICKTNDPVLLPKQECIISIEARVPSVEAGKKLLELQIHTQKSGIPDTTYIPIAINIL